MTIREGTLLPSKGPGTTATTIIVFFSSPFQFLTRHGMHTLHPNIKTLCHFSLPDIIHIVISQSLAICKMPLAITSECWDTWGAVMENLADNFEFPARTFETINGYLTIFTGPGSTLRVNTEMWKFVLDVIRQDDFIFDIVAITLISKAGKSSNTRAGWVITRPCRIHGASLEGNAGAPASIKNNEGSGNGDGNAGVFRPRWIKVTNGGRNIINCCTTECDGPFKSGKWKVFDSARMQIVAEVLQQQNAALKEERDEVDQERERMRRARNNSANVNEKLSRQIAQLKSDGSHYELQSCRTELAAQDRELHHLRNRLAEHEQTIRTLTEEKAKAEQAAATLAHAADVVKESLTPGSSHTPMRTAPTPGRFVTSHRNRYGQGFQSNHKRQWDHETGPESLARSHVPSAPPGTSFRGAARNAQYGRGGKLRTSSLHPRGREAMPTQYYRENGGPWTGQNTIKGYGKMQQNADPAGGAQTLQSNPGGDTPPPKKRKKKSKTEGQLENY
ncbi:hypothetical protein ACRALDRAFT_205911 [Sodiomyces alcalophilus JCM 7366]|uniref:uncharacterized protein n=1 Tax=Sodiomyces alcalophilus JCM 7366 TaxID=591952 RepID=UPI0039B5AF47